MGSHVWGAHPHDRPRSPCSSRGDDFWDNPGMGREVRTKRAAQPPQKCTSIFHPKLSFMTPPSTFQPGGEVQPRIPNPRSLPAPLYSLCNPQIPIFDPHPPSSVDVSIHRSAPHPNSEPPAHLPGHSQGDVALLARVQDLQLEVVAAGAERPPGLGQPHIHDALPLPHVLQHLGGGRGRARTRGKGAPHPPRSVQFIPFPA